MSVRVAEYRPLQYLRVADDDFEDAWIETNDPVNLRGNR